MPEVTLYHGDCLDILPTLDAGSVDAVIADPPYGTTKCKWDEIIPLGEMWGQIKRIRKSRSAVVLFATQPFTTTLISSNIEWFKHEWVWDKNRGNGHLVAKYRPMQQTESIIVFAHGSVNYYPRMEKRDKPRKFGGSPSQTELLSKQKYKKDFDRPEYTHRYPTNLLMFPWSNRGGEHPTQKPVGLVKYLVETYTREGDTVLDFAMGSGTTGVACVLTMRNFIGIEIDEGYYKIAERRIAEAQAQPSLFDNL